MKPFAFSALILACSALAGCQTTPRNNVPAYQIPSRQFPATCSSFSDDYHRYHVAATANDVYVIDLQRKTTYVLRNSGGKAVWEKLLAGGIPDSQ